MRIRIRGIVLVVAATLFAAACGNDDSSGEAEVPPTTTPTATTTREATPTPNATSTIPVEPCVEADALTVTAISLPGGQLDVGWSGVGHDVAVTHGNLASANLNCVFDECTVDGSNLAGRALGAPLPLSAGGISVCILNSVREVVTGTYDCAGCAELSLKLSVQVFPPQDARMPCPTCVGDSKPNDGLRRGSCHGGATPGGACDVGGIGADVGMLSNDCLPAGASIGDVDVDLNPLTTTSIAVEASVDCGSAAFPSGSCFCPGQSQPNPCEPDGVCPASGVCELGPIDSVCQGQPSRRCRSGTGTNDCEAQVPGAGSCVDQPRPCFGNRIARTGVCGIEQVELVSIFCVPATVSDAIDTIVGLPGPGAITLPASLVRTPR